MPKSPVSSSPSSNALLFLHFSFASDSYQDNLDQSQNCYLLFRSDAHKVSHSQPHLQSGKQQKKITFVLVINQCTLTTNFTFHAVTNKRCEVAIKLCFTNHFSSLVRWIRGMAKRKRTSTNKSWLMSVCVLVSSPKPLEIFFLNFVVLRETFTKRFGEMQIYGNTVT